MARDIEVAPEVAKLIADITTPARPARDKAAITPRDAKELPKTPFVKGS